ncbi:UDP-N-acetylmuramate--L-alanine ligase [Patescibacteria group bacterium]
MKHFHLIGIKGVGMTGLATLYKEWGNIVTGSDTEEEFFTDRILKDLKIPVNIFDEKNIKKGIDEVIYSTAYEKDHPERKKAKELGIVEKSYTEALAEIFNNKKGIMVTGSHGKTTSAAMLGRVLEEAGWDPTVLVGGEVLEWGRTARSGNSEWMIIEGDEYQAKILEMNPYAVLITNIEYDHPDFYKTPEDYKKVFKKLENNISSTGFVINGPFDKKDLGIVKLSVMGEHNQINAAGVFKIAQKLGINEAIIKKALEDFRGTKRRLEFYTAEEVPLVIIDDYAHHPSEIKAALKAVRARYPGRTITAVFQPHTFSRTQVFLEEFSKSFEDADNIVILEVYSSAREKKGDIGGENLTKLIQSSGKEVSFYNSIDEARQGLKEIIPRSNGVLITIGAGDVWRLARYFKEYSI